MSFTISSSYCHSPNIKLNSIIWGGGLSQDSSAVPMGIWVIDTRQKRPGFGMSTCFLLPVTILTLISWTAHNRYQPNTFNRIHVKTLYTYKVHIYWVPGLGCANDFGEPNVAVKVFRKSKYVIKFTIWEVLCYIYNSYNYLWAYGLLSEKPASMLTQHFEFFLSLVIDNKRMAI